jgi:DNA-directed RNA polymerase specialized sigma24 family protein
MTSSEICERIDKYHAAGNMSEMLRHVTMLAMKMTKRVDVAQDVVSSVWKSLHNYQPIPGKSFHVWVRKIIKRRTIGAWRAELRRTKPRDAKKNQLSVVSMPTEQMKQIEAPHYPAKYISHKPANRTTPRIIYPSAKAKRAFELKHRGLTDKQAAEKLGMTLNSYQASMSRWRKQLKGEIIPASSRHQPRTREEVLQGRIDTLREHERQYKIGRLRRSHFLRLAMDAIASLGTALQSDDTDVFVEKMLTFIGYMKCVYREGNFNNVPDPKFAAEMQALEGDPEKALRHFAHSFAQIAVQELGPKLHSLRVALDKAARESGSAYHRSREHNENLKAS